MQSETQTLETLATHTPGGQDGRREAVLGRDAGHGGEGGLRHWISRLPRRSGKARTGILLWLLGVPIPLILLFFLIKSCAGGG
jgi:hypothetical protein